MNHQISPTIFLAAIFLSFSFSASAHESHKESAASSSIVGTSIYNLKSTWTDQEGTSQKLEKFHGKKVVLAMAYTSCEHACPLLVEDMRKIQSKLDTKTLDNFVFILCSFDSIRDTPQKLKSYALKRKLDPDHWVLLNGDAHAVRELAAVLGIKYSKDSKGDFDHSNVISLIDVDGVVQFQQNGLGQDPAEFLSQTKK